MEWLTMITRGAKLIQVSCSDWLAMWSVSNCSLNAQPWWMSVNKAAQVTRVLQGRVSGFHAASKRVEEETVASRKAVETAATRNAVEAAAAGTTLSQPTEQSSNHTTDATEAECETLRG